MTYHNNERKNWDRKIRRRRAKVRDALLNLPEGVRFDQRRHTLERGGRGGRGPVCCCTAGVVCAALEHRGNYEAAIEGTSGGWRTARIMIKAEKMLGLSATQANNLFRTRTGTAAEAASAIQALIDDPACADPWRAGRKALKPQTGERNHE